MQRGRTPSVDLPDETSWSPQVRELVDRYRGDLIGTLLAIDETFGFLPRNVLDHVGTLLGVPPVRLYGIATFYRRFRVQPPGRHTLRICHGTACHVSGAPRVTQELSRRLGAEVGGTTADGLLTLETVACVGCCALAPVLRLDEELRGRLNVAEALRFVEERLEISE